MASPEVNIEPVWNCLGRPDLATKSVEEYWAMAKRLYRNAVDWYKATNRPFNHMGLVQTLLGQITNEFAMRLANHSLPAVMSALPIQPLPNERYQGQHIHHVPNQRYLDKQYLLDLNQMSASKGQSL